MKREDIQPIVIKISGHELTDHDYLTQFARTIHNMSEPVIVVHGGGSEITQLQQLMHIEAEYIDGLRITGADGLTAVEMVLCGSVNKRLVRYLIQAGLDAMGLSGVDRGLVRAVQLMHPTIDTGLTGVPTAVRADVLQSMLADGVTPVIAPVCLGEDRPVNYNVNADHVAGAIAGAVKAKRVTFVSNVEGVLVDGRRCETLTRDEAMRLIDNGVIFGGMIPKIKTALDALERGVPQAAITNLEGLNTHGGTILTQQP
jgi:acetylglutamate kinase